MESEYKSPSNLTKPRELYETKAQNLRLWSFFGASWTGYARRNAVIANMLLSVKAQRVFEFAGNGAFLARHAIVDPMVRCSVIHWVHSDFFRPTLRYASFLFHHEDILFNSSIDVDQAIPEHWEAKLPMTTLIPATCPATVVEILNLDTSNSTALSRAVKLTHFDTFVTISFEHFMDDLALIRSLPAGATFIFCVPNFDDPEHFRYFKSNDEVKARYSDILTIKTITIIPHGKHKKFVVHGVLKALDRPPNHKRSMY